ncbi:hypothetical protein FANTH_9161 [Fusarium anthophilum]|uniref:Uncharacterized protein n=1 Tax=Fusarium anthophilum TaxID=48485 RepID=A0A8H5DZU2_9HYPO|nr:hypothetical protein FANTH_9161 [Fusarium anthophilum]
MYFVRASNSRKRTTCPYAIRLESHASTVGWLVRGSPSACHTVFDKNLRWTGGQRNQRTLPFSEQCFQDIAKKLYIHDSINRVVSRANVSQFSAVKLEMARHDGHELLAHVYSARTSNAWDGDLVVSATYFPHYDTLDQIEARFLELDDPESLQHITEAEKLARKEEKRSAWLDMLYLRNQLMSWNTCLEALYEHADHLNRTTFQDDIISSQFKTRSSEEFTVQGESSSDSSADWIAPTGELSLVNKQEDQETNKAYIDAISSELRFDKSQNLESIRSSKGYMRRTGAKIQARLQEVIKDYNEKIRECTAGFEGMAMTTQWVSHDLIFFVCPETFVNSMETQGETNVEIALATSQDSRHMKSIALVTMIFLPGTFFASMFSMGFFEWESDDGTVSVFPSFWVYVVLAASFTALTVGAWWYLGVYRYKKHKNLSFSVKGRRLLSPKPLNGILRQTARALKAKVAKRALPP